MHFQLQTDRCQFCSLKSHLLLEVPNVRAMQKVAAIVLSLVSLQCLVCMCEEYWVRPTQRDTLCPKKNGATIITLTDIVQNPSRYLRSNTALSFCPGTHTTNQTGSILIPATDHERIDNLTLAGGSGNARATVDCGWNLSFAFQGVTNLRLSDMAFVNCGQEIPNEWIEKHTQWQQIQNGTHAALFLKDTSNVLIRNVHILGSNGYGLMGVNVLGTSQIIDCRFEDNYWRVGRSIDQQTRPGGNTLFLFCHIYAKVAIDMHISYTKFAHGIERKIQDIKASAGGLGFFLSSKTLTEARFTLLNCTFYNNTAPNGGNLIFITGNNTPSVHLNINSCRFHNGQSNFSGGGMYLTLDIQNNAEVRISNATFENNTANQTGGAMYINAKLSKALFLLSITNCNFTSNSAIQGPAILISPITRKKRLKFSNAMLSALTFSNNGPLNAIDHDCSSTTIFLKESHSGVLHLNRIESITLRNLTFKNNHNCSALYAKGSDITFLGKMDFINNTGRSGAAIALIATRNSQTYSYVSTLKLEQNTSVRIINNTAKEYGGGIMVNDDCKVGASCFFQIDRYQECIKHLASCSIQFEMVNNTAGLGGDSIFGRCFEKCYPSGSEQHLLNFAKGDNITAIQSLFGIRGKPSHSDIAAFPSKVRFCNDIMNCSSRINVTVFQGEKFNVNVSAVWRHCYSSTAIIRARILPENSGAVGERQNIQEVKKTCTNLTYSIKTDRDSVQLILSVEGAHISAVRDYAVVDVHFLKCPIGFELRPSAEEPRDSKCRCAQHIESEGIVCDITNKTIRIPAPMWIGNVTWANDVVLHMNCPLGYCKPNDIDVKLSEPDDQCSPHRTGVLCGKCQPGFSLTLGTSGHCQQCSNSSLWLLIVFATAGVALLCMLLICNFTVSTGTYSGLIFYANIIRGIHATFFLPQNRFLQPITVVLSTFIAWLNLDFGISTCFYDGLNAYHVALLQFVFPVYIWILVALLIWVSRCSITLSKLTGSNTVSVLATLFLLSYAKLLRAIIVAISATTLTDKDGNSKLHWLQDANLLYMDWPHTALCIIGVIGIVFYVLPFTLLVLLAPWLQGRSNHRLLHWVNRLKPLLDTYQGPYNDRFRYWTGLMLVLRAILFILFAANVRSDSRIDLFAITITVLGLLLFWLSTSRKFGAIYKEVKLDLINSFFLVNLGMFASGTLFLKSSENSALSQAVLATIMVGSAFTVFTCILIHHFYQLLRKLTSEMKYFQLSRNANKSPEADQSQVVGGKELKECGMKSPELNGSMNCALREPLLDQM